MTSNYVYDGLRVNAIDEYLKLLYFETDSSFCLALVGNRMLGVREFGTSSFPLSPLDHDGARKTFELS